MNKRITLVVLTLLAFCAANATRRALVIGIGDYPASSGWHKINGDKDILLVEEILIDNGFQKQNIVELCNQQATCAAIKEALEDLIATAQTADYVYIHFSGHGQQITDLNGDEEDGLDEAWIPYDAQFAFTEGKYEGQNHLIDDQLNGYLHRLRQKVGDSGKIVVIADACHSGGGSRSETDEELVVRGTAETFVVANAPRTATTTLYPIQWTFISACEPHQCNCEYKGNGSLTYALYQERSNFDTLTCEQLRQRVSSCIKKICPFFLQDPMLEVATGAENDIFL